MVTTRDAPRCAICDGAQWIRLPEIGPSSMASDWRVVPAPLRRCACRGCGVIRSCDPAADPGMFVHEYTLYAHPPSDRRERERQGHYAAWIARAVDRQPRRVLDVGCGNGSLLLSLGERWPSATLMGCDLSIDSVAHGLAVGMTLWARPVADLPADVQADLVVTVNVIEHAVDPLSLLRSLRDRVTPDGLIVIICPDGAKADVELLISDHVHSFARPHLENLVERAGLAPGCWAAAPEALGAFQMVIAEPLGSRHPSASIAVDEGRVRERAAYLQRWRELDARLMTRLGQDRVICFGIGETAGLLRAYAPTVWNRVRACTADSVADAGTFGALPVLPLARVPAHETLVVAVRPQDQQRVASALHQRFANVVTWYDLVAGDLT